jgi:hypothetical protein
MSDESVREHAVSLLSGHGAHLPFEQAVADVPEKLRGVVPEGASASPRCPASCCPSTWWRSRWTPW